MARGREWVGRSLTDDVSDAEVLRSTLAVRHWLRQTVRLDSISFCGAMDVLCSAMLVGRFSPRTFLSLSLLAHCVRRLCLSFLAGRTTVSCRLYRSSEL
jgi:hypothetical protein